MLSDLTLVVSSSYAPSQADVAIFKALSQAPYVNVARWYQHIKSFEAEFANLPGSSSAGETFLSGSGSGAAAASAPAAKEAEDDEEVDLFGDDEEEDAEAERIKAERVAAYNAKKANKPKTTAKVRLLPMSSWPLLTIFVFSLSLRSRSSPGTMRPT
jgi:elongation factor 1-beta